MANDHLPPKLRRLIIAGPWVLHVGLVLFGIGMVLAVAQLIFMIMGYH